MSLSSERMMRLGTLAVVGVGAATVTYLAGGVLLRALFGAADGPASMNDDQKALCTAPHTVGSLRVSSVPSSGPSLVAAAETLAAGNVDAPMHVACAAAGMTTPRRLAALQWLYKVLLRAVTPTGTGCIPLQTEGSKAVAVWWSKGNDVSLSQVMLSGGLGYIWQYSGWDRRGRFLGYAEVIREVRARIMRARGAERNYFYLLTYAHTPSLSKAEGAAQLAAVITPVTERADALGEACYLEISNSTDVPFFEGLGFSKLEGEGFKLFGVPQVAILVREPRKTA